MSKCQLDEGADDMGRKAGPVIDGVQLPPDAVVHHRMSPDAEIDWDDEPPLRRTYDTDSVALDR